MGHALIAVTGSSGYLGRKVVELLEKNCDVVRISHQENPYAENDPWARHLDLSRCTIEQARGALEHEGIPVDAVVHLGALTSVPASYETPQLFEAINATGTRTLVEASALLGVGHIVFASSITVHGNTCENPITRTSPLNPQSPYALSKAKAEHYLHAGSLGGIGTAVSVLRLTNLAGRYEGARGGGVTAYLAQAILSGQPVTLSGGYSTPDQSAERDMLDVHDAAELFTCALGNPPERGQVAVYPAGSGTTVSMRELAHKLMAQAGKEVPINYTLARRQDADHVSIDSSAARTELNWQARIPLEQTLSSELAHASQHGASIA